MKKYFLFVVLLFIAAQSNYAQVKILFDATKAETAGNADWVIDADLFNLGFNSGPATISGGNEANPQRIPTPAQSAITAATAESYWKGGISFWAVDCVKKGYKVETLPYNGTISYGNGSNTQDLSNYQIFVVVEPNIVFSAAEKTAIINFVQNGGSLFMVSDHTVSDRNNDGWDSPAIWNDLFTNNGIANNPFGISFDLTNISGSSTNISTYSNDSLLHGSYGNVTQVLWSNGATITINTTANPTVKAAVYKSGASNTGSTNVLVAYARYGSGKVVAVGDSSPFDDGTGDSNDQLYDGYITDASGNHQKLIMNATAWLATSPTLPVKLTDFSCKQNQNDVVLNWQTVTEINTSYFNIQKSESSKDFATIAAIQAKGTGSYNYIDDLPNANPPLKTIYYCLEVIDKNGDRQYSTIQAINVQHPSFDITIYPNPASQELHIGGNDIKQLVIMDNCGRIVKKLTNVLPQQTVNIQQLAGGIYFIKAVLKNGTVVNQKFIKN